MKTKAELIRQWRKIKNADARLYWRGGNNFRLRMMDRGVVALIRSGSAWIQFFSYDALEEYLFGTDNAHDDARGEGEGEA